MKAAAVLVMFLLSMRLLSDGETLGLTGTWPIHTDPRAP